MATLTLAPILRTELLWENLAVIGGALTITPAKPQGRMVRARSSSPSDDIQAIDWLSTLTDNPNQVRQYCTEQEILSEIVIAVRMAERIFPAESLFSLNLDEDPEINQKKLVVNVAVPGTVNDVLNCYDRFTREWVSSASWPKRSHIRLSYDIV
jgi:hypothetical protein